MSAQRGALDDDNVYASDMTLRDYFAAKAMQAMLVSPGPRLRHAVEAECEEFSRACYMHADAMLKARAS